MEWVNLPITLKGDNLGQRHRHFNELVQKVAEKNLAKDTIENIPEHSPVDRLFKIDLASKLRHTEYIIQNIKDDDMLYVSKALKAKWLLEPEYRDIMNPKYLEEALFPEMVTTAITKMKHWLYINLRDAERCLEFYQYYKEVNFNFAIKFLYHCNVEDIKQEFPNILTKLTPHHLKIFSEVCHELAKVYFDALATDTTLAAVYLTDKQRYFKSVKSLLKSNPDMFRNISEKYYQYQLSPGETAHIMRHHKDWFTAKSEYYTASLLHIPTIAKYLTGEESKEVILKMARADYLQWWFSYRNVEPLVKKIDVNERAAFKKRVFVEKDVGTHVKEWPYAVPAAPDVKTIEPHVFDDLEHSPISDYDFRSMLKKRKYAKWATCPIRKAKTELDHLFDEFRFAGFDRTFHELSRRLGAVSSMDSRRNILLVLVSKTGGRFDAVYLLLELLAKHRNEPSNLRAAVIRSLVKRACVWRLPDEAWTKLLEFGRGLGLDGGPAEDDCEECLHAVVLRQFLSDNICEEKLRHSFLENFSTFKEYPLTANEKAVMISSMTHFLVNAAAVSEPGIAGELLCKLFDVYKKHKFRIEAKSEVVNAVNQLVERNHVAAREMLRLLYNARVARKELFLANVLFIQKEREYLNVLRHKPEVLSPVDIIKQLCSPHGPRLDKFFRKISIYFRENGGLSELMLNALTNQLASEPNPKQARPLVTLFRGDLKAYLQGFKPLNNFPLIRVAVMLRANIHHARPKLDIETFELDEIGAKAMANLYLVCRSVDVEKSVSKLLTWRRTVRIALTLAQRGKQEVRHFTTAIQLRPQATLKAAMLYLGRRGEDADTRIWYLIKPHVLSLKFEKPTKVEQAVSYVKRMPSTIKEDYFTTIFISIIKNASAIDLLYKDLEEILPNMSDDQLKTVLSKIIERFDQHKDETLYANVFIKYLLLCKTEKEQMKRIENIGHDFLDRLRKLLMKVENNRRKTIIYTEHFNMTLECLKCNEVFFDARYVSCLPVFKTILSWMKEILPLKNNFKKYVEMHLTMLYYTAVKQGIEKAPEVFNEPIKKLNEGVDIVGVLFGRYIARDLRELMAQYFESVIDLYKDPLQHYMTCYFVGSSSKKQFITAVINGILEEGTGKECRIAVYLMKYVVLSDDLKALMERNGEIKFFMYAMK